MQTENLAVEEASSSSSTDRTPVLGFPPCMSGKNSNNGNESRLKGTLILKDNQLSLVMSQEPNGIPTRLATIPMVMRRKKVYVLHKPLAQHRLPRKEPLFIPFLGRYDFGD